MTLPENSGFTASMQKYVVHGTRYCQLVAKRLWDLLHPSLSIVHYRATTLFLDFRMVCTDICEEVIAEALVQSKVEERVEGCQRFALLWRLTGEIGATQR
eukprot:TRINITY_DN8153_c0_g1_i1.p1 TRINITY_DN8153_c0_g1~~TRINITY_DN8153_c0_g1_i1.p1  ORF type:complete len:100 (-),score=14.20 TRINITY_DN8153_c0_g1_i1:30-329(-)